MVSTAGPHRLMLYPERVSYCCAYMSALKRVLPGKPISHAPPSTITNLSASESESACLVGCLRRLQHWSVCAIHDEVRRAKCTLGVASKPGSGDTRMALHTVYTCNGGLFPYDTP